MEPEATTFGVADRLRADNERANYCLVRELTMIIISLTIIRRSKSAEA